MKLVLLIVAGAFATQDVTPPVISLSFSDERYGYDGLPHHAWRGICSAKVTGEDDSTCQAKTTKSSCNAESTKCEWHSGQDANGHFQDALKTTHTSSASVMCYVDSSDTTCPDPTCTASDHHDTDVKCDDPTVVMIQRNLPGTTKYDGSKAMLATHADHGTSYPSWAGSEDNSDFTDAKGVLNSAKDDTCVQAGTATGKWKMTYSHKYVSEAGYEGSKTCVNRDTLGQYLVTYSARDRSGNEADKVSFSFLFVDPFVPHFTFVSAHKDTGYKNRMKFWPTLEASDVGTTASAAVYDTTTLAVESTNYNTWGAFYSAWSTVKQNSHDPFVLLEKEFSDKTLTGSDYASTESRFDFENTAQAPEGWNRFDNLEAGNCKGTFGGFISAVDEGEEKIISGETAFCAANVAGTAAYGTTFLNVAACKDKTKTQCEAQTTACRWIAGCDRTAGEDSWAYPVSATVSDNYRDAGQMTVYYKVKTAAWSEWKVASQTTATTESLCMRPGTPYVIDWIVSDQAGIFGFEHKDNMQTHRIQITVSDNTRPVIYPVTYGTNTKSEGESSSQTDIDEFTTSNPVADLKDFTWMKCSDMTQENLCKGECTWSSGVCARNDGEAATKVAYSCRDPAGDVSKSCSGKTTSTACWNAAGGIGSCVWTRTAMMTRSSECDSEVACTATQAALEVTVGSVQVKRCKTYQWTDRSAFTGSNTVDGSTWAGTTAYKCRSQQTTGVATSNDPSDTTIFLECGTLSPAAPSDPASDATQITADGKRGVASDTYTEHGFLAEDNWDNYNNVGSCKGSHQEIHCVPSTTTPQSSTSTATGATTKGTCEFDNTQLAHTTTDGEYLQAIEGAANGGATFLTDYLVAYKYTDASSNTAWPVTRRVIVDDTKAPELTVRGDCTIENSAGAHTNDGAVDSVTKYACVASHDGTDWNHDNRFNKTCAELASSCAATATSCDACTGNCYWQRNSADTLVNGAINTSPGVGDGLFDHDRIAKFFDHRDNCDRNVITVVTLHEGACDRSAVTGSHNCAGQAAASSKLKCGKDGNGADIAVAKCALDVFKWNGEEVHDQSHATESIFAGGAYKQSFPEYEAGTYAVQYKTIDASGHEVTACRTIENVDHTHPIIQILGSDQMTLEATHQGNYIDDGATCSDQVDGVISQNVEVSGDVVNLSKVGTYTITYNCKDSANNEAPAAQRTVVVAQTSCPKCTIFGQHSANTHSLVHEASFPYTDAGATCSDVIDGGVTTLCSTDNPSASTTTYPITNNLQNSAALCGDGSSLVDVETTGTYEIVYRAVNTVGLANDDANCRGGPNQYKRTVEIVDTLKPVITLKYSNNIVAQGTKGVSNEATKTTVDYPSPQSGVLNGWTSQGNFDDPHTPSLMAEQTTSAVNGWVIGAFASAVAGLALLGYSTRRTTVATSVPV